MCLLLVGLSEVNVLAIDDDDRAGRLRVHVETRAELVGCAGCGSRARLKDRRAVSLVDLAAFGRRTVLVWHKRRWSCLDPDCEVRTFTEVGRRIAAPRAKLTDRAGRWVTIQVGWAGRTVAEVADELGCD
jgi:transposase